MSSVAASVLASSVLPTPAGPSTRIGFSMRSARKTAVAISFEGRYPASSRRRAVSWIGQHPFSR